MDLAHQEPLPSYTKPLTVYSQIKVKKDCLWKQRTHKNHENWRLGLTESLHMKHCSLRSCIRTPLPPAYAVFDFQNSQNGLNDPKEIKYNLYYDDVG